MDFKKLEKATKKLEKLKELDKEIIEIDKMAISILNNETKISFDLNVENITKKQDEESKGTIDEDGSLSVYKKMHEEMSRSLMWGIRIRESSEKKKENVNTLSKSINDKIALQILGVLLCEKNSERNSLIKELNLLGFA